MLKQRIATALVLIPLVLWFVLYSSTILFDLVLAAVISIAAYEWAMLSGLSKISRYFYVLVNLLVIFLLWHFQSVLDFSLIIIGISIIWAGTTASLIVQKEPLIKVTAISYYSLVVGLIFLTVAWVSVSQIHAIAVYGPELVLALLILIWVADTSAYFTGRSLGHTKLSVHVSPGKTWEGVIGALVGSAIYGYFLASYQYFEDFSVNPLGLSLLCVVITFISVGGDLFESKVKRQRGVKDSGNILPGHGGIYDRIDSLIAAAPIFLLGLLVISGEVRL